MPILLVPGTVLGQATSGDEEEERLPEISLIITSPASLTFPDNKEDRGLKKLGKLASELNSQLNGFVGGTTKENMSKSQFIFKRQYDYILEQDDPRGILPLLSGILLSGGLQSSFADPYIIPSLETPGREPDKLQAVAEQFETQYVLSFPSIQFLKEKRDRYAEIEMLVYDGENATILIDTLIDTRSMVNDVPCNNKDFYCSLFRGSLPIIESAMTHILSTNKGYTQFIKLQESRGQALMTEFELARGNTDIAQMLKSSIQGLADETELLQHFMASKDGNQFVATIVENKPETIWHPETNEPTQYYNTYFIYGVNVNGWYLRFDKKNEQEAESAEEAGRLKFIELTDQDIFQKNTAWFSKDFWEKNHFERVKPFSESKSDNREFYEFVYGPFIGRYEIEVANLLEKRRLAYSMRKYDNEAQIRIIKSKACAVLGQKYYDFVNFKNSFYQPADESVWLIPMLVDLKEEGPDAVFFLVYLKSSGRLFFLEKENLPTAYKLVEDIFPEYARQQLLNISGPDTPSMENDEYWTEHILKHKNNSFLYLKEIHY